MGFNLKEYARNKESTNSKTETPSASAGGFSLIDYAKRKQNEEQQNTTPAVSAPIEPRVSYEQNQYTYTPAYTDTASSRYSREDVLRILADAKVAQEQEQQRQVRYDATSAKLENALTPPKAPMGIPTVGTESIIKNAKELAAERKNNARGVVGGADENGRYIIGTGSDRDLNKLSAATGVSADELRGYADENRNRAYQQAYIRMAGGDITDTLDFMRNYKNYGYTDDEANQLLYATGNSLYGTLGEADTISRMEQAWENTKGQKKKDIYEELKYNYALRGEKARENADFNDVVNGVRSGETVLGDRSRLVSHYVNALLREDAKFGNTLLNRDSNPNLWDDAGYRNNDMYTAETNLAGMSDEDKATLLYLAYTDPDFADKWIRAKEDEWAQKVANDANINDAPILKKFAVAAGSGIDSFFQGVADLFSGKPRGENALQYQFAALREGTDSSITRGIYDIIQNTAHMAPSILLGKGLGLAAANLGATSEAVGQVSGLANALSVGTSAAGNAKAQALREGFSAGEATAYGLLNGASEALLEKFLASKFVGGGVWGNLEEAALKKIDNTLIRAAVRIGSEMGSEFTEEYLQEVLDPVFRNIVFNENNEVKLFTEEALYAGILGALSGGLMSAGASWATTLNEESVGKLVDLETLKREALTYPGTQAEELAMAIGDNPSDARKGALANAVTDARIDAYTARADEIADDLGVSKRTLRKIAKGQTLSDAEAQAVISDPKTSYAVEELTGLNFSGSDIVKGEWTANYAADGVKFALDAWYDTTVSPLSVSHPDVQAEKPVETAAVIQQTEPQVAPTATEAVVAPIEAEQTTRITPETENAKNEEITAPEEAVADESKKDSWDKIGKDFGKNGQKAFAEVYDESYTPGELAALHTDFNDWYNAGVENTPVADVIERSADSRMLATTILGAEGAGDLELAAYKAGRSDAKYGINEVVTTGKHGNTLSVVGTEVADGIERDTVDLLKSLVDSGAARENIVLYKSVNGKIDGDVTHNGDVILADGQEAPNGMVTLSDGTVLFDLAAGNKGEGTVLYTVAHEYGHIVAKKNPGAWSQITDFVKSRLGEEQFAKLVANKAEAMKRSSLWKTSDSRIAEEDVVCDSLAEIGTKGDFFEQLEDYADKTFSTEEEKRSFFQAIRDFFNKILDRLKKAYANLRPDTEAAKAMSNDIEGIQKLADMMAKAYNEISDAAATTEEAVAEQYKAQQGDARYSIRETESGANYVMLDKDIFVDGDGNPLTPRQAYNALVGQRITLDDGDTITFVKKLPGNRDMYNELFRKYPAFEGDVDIKAISDSVNKNIVEAITGSTIEERKQKQRHQHLGVTDFDKRNVYVYDGNKAYDLKLSIANLTDGSKVAYAKSFIKEADAKITAEIKKAETAWKSQPESTSSVNYTTTPSAKSQEEISKKIVEQKISSDNPDARYSARDTDSTGRELSAGQQEYFKDSKIRDDEGRLQVVYHGTEADFTVFDTSIQGGKNGEAEGFGIYITPSKAVTEHYGGRQMEMYANITKPARSDVKTIGVTKLAKLIESTTRAEAKTLVEEEGYDTISDALKDTWISNYVNTYDMPINVAYTEVAQWILGAESGDMGVVQEVMAGMGIRDYEDAMDFYREHLVPVTGFDGFATAWENRETGNKVPIYLAFESSQLKNVDNLNPTKNEDIRFSEADRGEQTPESIREAGYEELRQQLVEANRRMAEEADALNLTNRELLANALETVAKGDAEYDFLQRYRENVEVLNETEAQLDRVRSELRNAIFANGGRNLAKIEALTAEAKHLQNKLNWWDKKLMTAIEASKPLRGVLAREKQKAYKKAREEARAKVDELRNQRELRDAQDRLLNMLRRVGNKKLSTPNRAWFEQHFGDIYTLSKELTGKKLATVADLQKTYDALKDPNSPDYDPNFIGSPRLEARFAEVLNKTKDIKSMDLDEIYGYTYLLAEFMDTVENSNKLAGRMERRDIHDLAYHIITDVSATKGPSNKLTDFINTETLNPMLAIQRYTGFNDNDPLYRAAQELVKAQGVFDKYVTDANEIFEPLLNDKEFVDFFNGKKGKPITVKAREVTGEGNVGEEIEIEITPALRAFLYLNSFNDDNLNHIAKGGVILPSIKSLAKGKYGEMYSAEGSGKVLLTPEEIRKITAGMTEKEKRFAEMWKKYNTEMATPEISRVHEEQYGVPPKMVDEGYFPIRTKVPSNTAQDALEAMQLDGATDITSPGWLKERKDSALPIYAYPADMLIKRAIEDHARFVAYSIPLNNFNKLWNASMWARDSYYNAMSKTDDTLFRVGKSVKDVVGDKWGKRAVNTVQQMMDDIAGKRRGNDSEAARAANKLRSNYAQAKLAAGFGTAIKQIPSGVAAAATVGFKPLAQMLDPTTKIDTSFIDDYTAAYKIRKRGYSSTELGDLARRGKKIPKWLVWYQTADLATTKTLKRAAAFYVRDNTDLKPGTEEYKQAVADTYDQLISESQPTYDVMYRAKALRSTNPVWKALNMFKTQPYKNYSILYGSLGNLQAKRNALNDAKRFADLDEQGKAEYEQAKQNYNEAKKRVARAFVSQAISGIMIAAAMALSDFLITGNTKKYKDDEGDVTLLSFLKGLGINFASTVGGMIPLGGVALEVLENAVDKISGSKIFDSYSYGVKVPEVEMINDAAKVIDDFIGILQGVSEAEEGSDWEKILRQVWDKTASASELFGIPGSNLTKFAKAIGRNLARTQGKYMGEYYALRIMGTPEQKKQAHYDNLYKAYKNDKAQYQEIYNDLIDNGVTEKAIKDAMESRMKAEQGVSSVKELGSRYLSPTQQKEYDKTVAAVKQSNVYYELDSSDRARLNELAYEVVAQDGWKNTAAVKDNNLNATEYVLYQLALDIVDQPNNKGNYGTYTDAEKAAAVKMAKGN